MKNFLPQIRKGWIIALGILFFTFHIHAQQVARGLTASNGEYIGFYEFKPYDYNNTTTKYPLIIFLHGTGERGNGTTELNRVLYNAIPKYCANGATMTYNYNGQSFSFLVLSPQLNSSYGTWENFYVEEMIKHARQNLRVDPNRIYLCGLSLGGGGVWKYATASGANALGLAAIAPVCATSEGSTYCHIAQQSLPVWAFHALDDYTVHWTNTRYCLDQINACSPIVAPKVMYYPDGGHGIWDRAFDMQHNFQTPNVYEWFLSNSRTAAPPGNAPPVANAGADISFNLPTNSTTLNGSGSYDPNGSIAGYSWTKISGPNQFIIANPSSASTTLSNLAQGTYSFKLVVTDNAGATDEDFVTVTVNAPVNQSPIAKAGADASFNLPVNSTNLDGSGSYDPDGTIAYYGWSKLSGPAQYAIQDPYNKTTPVSNLVQGTYSFLLVVTDNNGATGKDTVVVTVGAGIPIVNQPPAANAGADINIILPVNNTNLNGNASSDPDGTVSGYAWSKISGPDTYTIVNPSASVTSLNGLVQGVYNFRLLVTDNTGATDADTVVVTVNAAPPPPNQLPVANAGNDISITLPLGNTSLNGSASYDTDGTISSYSWSKVSGPGSFVIANPPAAVTNLTGLVQGVYIFRLIVADNNGATDIDSVVVTVNAAPPPPNQPPAANAGADVNISLPVNNTTLDGAASSDADGTISSYSWSKINGPAAYTIMNPSSVITTVNNLIAGTYTFRLAVTDNNGATNADTVVVTVSSAPPPPPNQIPVANAGADVNITLPVNGTTLSGSASSDPDGTIVNFNWSKISGPASYSITNAATSSTSITSLVQGTYSFRLVVTDNAGATDDDTVFVTINPAPNQLPLANAGADIWLTLPVNNTTLNGSASSDPDGSINNYSWTKIGGPATYNIINSGSVNTALTNLVQGVYSFRLDVTDNNGAMDADTVLVTVNAAPPPPNQLPIANAGTDITIVLPATGTTLNGSASSDPDGFITNHAWSKISGPASYNIGNADNSITTLSSLVQGTYLFRLVVTDNGGATDSDTLRITVNAAPPIINQLPVANAGADMNISLPVNNTTLNGSASFDPDGSITKYLWSKISGPVSFTIANSSSVTTSLTNLVQGTYLFALSVTDNSGAVDTDTMAVIVNAAPPPPNQLPVANAGADIVVQLPSNSGVLDGTASYDLGGSIVSYYWIKLSGPSQFTMVNASAAATVINGLVQGTYLFQLTIADNDGAFDTDTVKVTVNAPSPSNQPPFANGGADITVILPVSTLSLNGAGSFDPDGNIVNYSWIKVSGPPQYTIANPTAAVTQVTGLSQGVYIFKLVVTDNGGATAEDSVYVFVTNATNLSPIANSGKDTTINLPVTGVTLNGNLSKDPDGVLLTYQWKQLSGPTLAEISSSKNAITFVNNLQEGKYEFELKVTDIQGAVSTDNVKVTVVNNFKFSQYFRTYPNPVTNIINFTYIDDARGKTFVTIMNTEGKIVMEHEFRKEQSLIFGKINISALPPGLYYLQVMQSGTTRLTRPFVKQ
jgi:predicted esterase